MKFKIIYTFSRHHKVHANYNINRKISKRRRPGLRVGARHSRLISVGYLNFIAHPSGKVGFGWGITEIDRPHDLDGK